MKALHVYFYLSKKKINQKGKCPIYARIALDTNTRADISTGLFVAPDEWDFKYSLPKESPMCHRERLLLIELKIRNAINFVEKNGACLPKKVVEYLRENDKVPGTLTIKKILDDFIKDKGIQGRNETKHRLALKQFCAITKVTEITQIEQKHLNQFVSKSTDNASSKNKKLSYVNRLINYSIGLGYSTANPFAGFTKLKTTAPEIIQLTPVELERLQFKNFDLPRLDQVRDLFLLQCHTGLAYCDLQQINKSLVLEKNGFLYFKGKRQKTGSDFLAPLSKVALGLLEKYDFDFKVLTNQKMNAYLKEIAVLCRIDKPLTTHVGRKTFAQNMIDTGYSGESVSRMLGHAKFDMTQKHYGKIGDTRVQMEVEKMTA